MDYLIVFVLLVLSAMFSGLTLGILSLDKQSLERKVGLGDRDALRVLEIRRRPNLLLCTFLLGNVAVNTSIAIIMNGIVSSMYAGLLATGMILVFGEVLPQAIVPRFALKIGAALSFVVRVMIFIFFPIAAPLAWGLDKMLGDEEPIIYTKHELMGIVGEHEKSTESDVDQDELRIVKGALSYSEKKAEDVMTPRTVVYALDFNDVLNDDLLKEIRQRGFTRIPVFNETIDNVVGLFYVKDLIGRGTGEKVGSLCHTEGLLRVAESDRLDNVLNMMLIAKHHMALVVDQYGGMSGILTMEDIVEEIIDYDIVDETDEVKDLRKFAMSRHQAKGAVDLVK